MRIEQWIGVCFVDGDGGCGELQPHECGWRRDFAMRRDGVGNGQL